MSEMTITNVTPVPIAVAWGMAKKGNEIMPKVMPAFFAAIEVLEGDGGAGTVRVVTLGEGAGPEGAGKKVKERVDVMDDATHTISYTVVEGGDPRYTNVQFTLKFTPAGDTTSVEWTVRYTPVNDSVPPPQHMKAMYESSMEAMSAYAKQHAAEFA